MLKSLLFLYLATIIAGSIQQAQPKNAFDDADALLAEYTITVQTVLTKASNQLEETMTEIDTLGSAILQISIRIIRTYQRDFLDQIFALDDLAALNDIDPLSCTFYPRRQLVYWTPGQEYIVRTCIEEIIQTSNLTILDAFSNLNNLEDSVSDFAAKIESCRSEEDEICVTVVISQLSLQNDLIPEILDGDIQAVLSQFSNMDLYFQECARAPTDELILLGHELVDFATECMDNLLREKESSQTRLHE